MPVKRLPVGSEITPVEPTTPKKRGAPLGNQNALTHGFYARRLPQSQLDGLEETTVRSLEDEIGVMRVFSRKVAELGAEVDDLDEAKSVLNSLSLATGSINRLVRTHTHIPALELDPSAMLREALLELQLEWPELRKFGHQFRTQEEIEKIEEEAAAYMAAHPELQNAPPPPAYDRFIHTDEFSSQSEANGRQGVGEQSSLTQQKSPVLKLPGWVLNPIYSRRKRNHENWTGDPVERNLQFRQDASLEILSLFFYNKFDQPFAVQTIEYFWRRK